MDILIVGFCPGENTKAGSGGFDWAPYSAEAVAWARKRIKDWEVEDPEFDFSAYVVRATVPDGLNPEDVTSYIDERLYKLEPAFLEGARPDTKDAALLAAAKAVLALYDTSTHPTEELNALRRAVEEAEK